MNHPRPILYIKLAVFLFLSLPATSFSLPRVIEKIGIEKGLSDNCILSIAQDRKGFMWFGTEWGLNRFDGCSFKSYKTHLFDGNTVSGNGINKILVDQKEPILWIATKTGGLNVFNCSTQRFIHYPVSTNESNSTKSSGITDLCFAEDGNLWIATYMDGLKKLDRKTNRIFHLNALNLSPLKDYKIRCIADDGKGNLYIGYLNEGLGIYSVKERTVRHFRYSPGDPKGLPDNEVLDICIDSRKRVWLATHAGLALYHSDTEKFTVFRNRRGDPGSLIDTDVHSVTEIEEALWVGTWSGGISILDLKNTSLLLPDRARFRHILSNDFPTGLSAPSAVEIFQDSFGNVWVGTYGGGVNFIGHNSSFFNTLSYSPIKGDENGLSGKTATTVCYDAWGWLWVGTGNKGIDVYNAGRKIRHYDERNRALPNNNILSSLADSRGTMWFGVDRNGLMRFDARRNLFEKVKLSKLDRVHTYVTCIYEDNAGNIWVGTNDGVLRYDPVTGDVTELDLEEIRLVNGLIRSICQDVGGNIWIGSWIDGVSVVSPRLRLLRTFNRSNGFISGSVNQIYRDSGHRMWVTTPEGAAVFPNCRNSTFYAVDQKKGLPDPFVRAVAEGRPGEMWMTTSAGISKYLVEKGEIENYDHHDGLPRGTFMSAVVAKASDGTVFFGGQDGVCYFNSVRVPEPSKIPRTVITNFGVYDTEGVQPNHLVPVPVAPKMALKYNQNTFTIDFSAMDYALKDRVEYAYSMEGVDGLWYQTNGQNQVTFRNLSPGTYTFHVKSRLRNQEWGSESAAMQVVIAPPFWLSGWAKTMYVVLGLFIILGVIRFYKRRLNLENQLYLEKQNHLQEQELNEEKLRFYTNVAHELRTPLTLIIGPLEDLAADKDIRPEQTKKISLIHRSAVRLSNLINQIMEFRKSETHHRTLSVMQGDLSSLVREIALKYEEFNQNKEVSVDLCIEATPWVYYDREVMTIVLDNIISNALKYTQRGVVSIILREVSVEDIRTVEIEIRDTGTGMPDESLNKIFDCYYQVKGEHQAFGTGIGLALVKSLVELHEGTIEVKSKVHGGTSFYVRIKADYTYPQTLHTEAPPPVVPSKKDSSPLLLVVEDHADIRDYIVASFFDSFEVLTAEDGREGVTLATDKIPDLIISDIMMPVMDGIDLCRTLKEDMRTSHIPIILLTAKDSERDRTEGYSIGADSYITKPFSANLLKTRVANLLKGRERVVAYFSTAMYKKAVASDAFHKLDHEFVEKIVSLIEEHMASEQISVAFLAEQLRMSYSTFSRKTKALTGMTANELIRKIKMRHAEQLLLSGKYTVSEVVFQVGYSSLAYFREAFKAEFGVLPSDYMKNLKKKDGDSGE